MKKKFNKSTLAIIFAGLSIAVLAVFILVFAINSKPSSIAFNVMIAV